MTARKNQYFTFYVIAVICIAALLFLYFIWRGQDTVEPAPTSTAIDKILAEDIKVPTQHPDDKMAPQPPATSQPVPTTPLEVESPVVPDPVNKETVAALAGGTPSPQVESLSSSEPSSQNFEKEETVAVHETLNNNDLPAQNTPEEQPLTKNPSSAIEDRSTTDTSLSPCEKTARHIIDFYNHLDQQKYIQSYNLPEPSNIYFSHLIQKLLDNPPVVTGETDDLFTVLQNTAHFFRVIGKDNIILLKAILDKETKQFETVLQDFYALIHIPGCLQEHFGLTVSNDALYDYAGFFLNSMGGRLYLFRRDSKSRMIVSYYSILLIDMANQRKENKHGINLATHINQLIDEFESTNNEIILLDEYLDKLYQLQDHYTFFE